MSAYPAPPGVVPSSSGPQECALLTTTTSQMLRGQMKPRSWQRVTGTAVGSLTSSDPKLLWTPDMKISKAEHSSPGPPPLDGGIPETAGRLSSMLITNHSTTSWSPKSLQMTPQWEKLLAVEAETSIDHMTSGKLPYFSELVSSSIKWENTVFLPALLWCYRK